MEVFKEDTTRMERKAAGEAAAELQLPQQVFFYIQSTQLLWSLAVTAPRRGERPIGRANASEDRSGAQTSDLHGTSDVLAESPRGSTEVRPTRGQAYP